MPRLAPLIALNALLILAGVLIGWHPWHYTPLTTADTPTALYYVNDQTKALLVAGALFVAGWVGLVLTLIAVPRSAK